MLIDQIRVLSGSCNLFNASLNRTEEYCIIQEDQDLYKIFIKQFKKLWKEKSFKPKNKINADIS